LQVSDDNANWTTIKTVDNSTGGIEDWTGLGAQGRYLRMKGVKRSTNYGYSIFEIQAYSGGATTDPPPTTTPDPVPVDTTKPGVAIKPVTATSSPWRMPVTRPPTPSTARPARAGPAPSMTAHGSSSTSA
jgi:hypothetical protein